MNKPTSRLGKSGFTLVEMLVGLGISLILIVTVLSTFLNNRKTYSRMGMEQEMQQQVRSALKRLQQDIRLCGSGVVMGESQIPDWFPSQSGVTTLPHVASGALGSDRLTLVGYSGSSIGTLNASLSPGATSLTIVPNSGLNVPYVPKVGDVLVLGSIEALKVESVSGNTITFRTDPTVTGTGTLLAYPSGFSIYELSVVTYELTSWNGSTGLMREDSRYTYSQNADKIIAMHVEAFDATITGDQIALSITGKTRAPMVGYAEEVDEYPRFTLSVNQHMRNVTPEVYIQFWDENVISSGVSGTGPTSTPSPSPTPAPTPTPVPTVRPHDYSGRKQDCWCWGTSEKFFH